MEHPLTTEAPGWGGEGKVGGALGDLWGAQPSALMFSVIATDHAWLLRHTIIFTIPLLSSTNYF